VKKKIHELERMSPMQRRRFLKWMGAALAAPLVPAALRQAANAVAGGEAWAQHAEDGLPRYFLEINLRDQWDHGHLMVAPGLATASNLPRPGGDVASAGQTALFFGADELTRHDVNGTAVYLTRESRALAEHLDSIAMIDLVQLGQGDIHGHESANPARSPGKSKTRRSGQREMWLNDPVDNFPQGCEAYYSSTPTPASMFNAWQKTQSPGLKNGIAFKGISRGIHTAYHYAGALGSAGELDRHYARSTLYAAFPEKLEDYNVLDRPEQADAFARVLERIDPRLLDRRGFSDAAVTGHGAELNDARARLYVGEPRLVSMPLSEDEVAFWGEGVPPQAAAGPVRGQIWEQMAWAFKLFESDQCRAVALEFDWVDVHDTRSATQMRFEAAQTALPLARMIAKLKQAGLYDRTTIAIYTTDGSRSPDGGSYGNEGKNTLILAGGGVKGGYYGDIRYAGGGRYGYAAPDEATGAPRPAVQDNSSRLSAARIWRTVMRAAGVPDGMIAQFPDVAGAQPLPWLLRG
jgi:hypothetical protein